MKSRLPNSPDIPPPERRRLRRRLRRRPRRRLRRRLLAWYRRHRRELPWRGTRNPYAVWVSEIMLQQTQVATVDDYFGPFMETFPTVEALAGADEEAVLRQWEGLGYYRRARQMHAAARRIVDEHGGRFPHNVATLQTLPGIGRYTAGAIASIAFDEPAPIVEANTARLFARLIGSRDAPSTATGQRLLWATAEMLLPRRGVGEFNQALMELGSLVCTPDRPHCDTCPIVPSCAAFAAGIVDQIPRKKQRPKTTAVHEAAVVVVRRGRVLLRRCGEQERWAGLWDFPRFACNGTVLEQMAARVREQTGVTVRPRSLLATITHAVTRYRITLDCYAATYVSGRPRSSRSQPVQWLLCRDLPDYPLSSTGRKLASLVEAAKA